jgi:hypothetical protein
VFHLNYGTALALYERQTKTFRKGELKMEIIFVFSAVALAILVESWAKTLKV